MSATLAINQSQVAPATWPDRREIPCRDLDFDCFAFDGVIPFGGYARCQDYAPELGRCIFLHDVPADDTADRERNTAA